MRGLSDPLLRAWLALIALSGIATAVALLRPDAPPWAGTAAGAVILGLAWLKARVILDRYLDLAGYPAARRGFGAGLGFFALAALVLHALA
ncbi:cytochrome C oxidase subunit IV family protein [Paracoccus sp. (in: a-proteobacteria)]|uniref:cytochrome C oxidase subunit IV family protein n=1 Tax=Paracoccus sp. TaxID=267 RepID=UPI0026DEB0ED|nr:cytochrome C oxidase subunit IV family protein [Paracoccus sp. (in: a-proteobacteria)]MDO5370664.1 cytochrome C oxidase subunit IV family protein [Paracoccus sp. (in: a-proteobacteria)]